MDSYPSTPKVDGDRSPSQAQLFAEAILRRPSSQVVRPQVSATARRAELERLAPLSPRHAQELHKLRADEGEARRERELLEWSAQISTRAEKTLHAIRQAEARQRGAWRAAERFADSPLTEWNEADHPRAPKGTSIGGQWISKDGGSIAADRQDDEESDEERLPDELIVTAEMLRARHKREAFSDLLQAAREMGTAIVAGLGTGVKAIINGLATAVKDVATLGLNPGQLELLGVSDEDRARGYDTAATIATGSGQVLIAVGTGGMTSALAKGGAVARTASGALVVYDAAGNAVGVVQGVYDASQNGVTLASGTQIAAGALGLGANVRAAADLARTRPKVTSVPGPTPKQIDEFVATLPRKNTPTKRPASQYEIKHAGTYNYELLGGGVKFEIDGYRGTTILEAKHVDKLENSPYLPGSSCPPGLRTKILNEVREELQRARTIIESGTTPFKDVEIITNTPESKKLFETLLKEVGVRGNVRLAL